MFVFTMFFLNSKTALLSLAGHPFIRAFTTCVDLNRLVEPDSRHSTYEERGRRRKSPAPDGIRTRSLTRRVHNSCALKPVRLVKFNTTW